MKPTAEEHRIALAVQLIERLVDRELDRVRKQGELGALEDAYRGMRPALLIVKKALRIEYGVDYNVLVRQLKLPE